MNFAAVQTRSMVLRKNRLLKILAVLLFTLEILSPALVFSATFFQEETKQPSLNPTIKI